MTQAELRALDADTPPEVPSNPIRVLSDAMNEVLELIGAPEALLNETFATATAGLAALVPPLPAATMLSPHFGVHGHVHLPFSPLPGTVPMVSFGPILFGCSVQVLVSGLPAARLGDIGLAPTCGGFTPFFQVFTGSSKVFIGGAWAARMTDLTRGCLPAAPAAKGLKKVLSLAQDTVEAFGTVAAVVEVAADASDAMLASDPAVAAGHALGAATGAAQLVVDQVKSVVEACMGLDPAAPPTIGTLLMGSPFVQVGGFPMVGWGDMAQGIFRLVKGFKKRKSRKPKKAGRGAQH